METLRQRLSIFILCAAVVLGCASAQSTLSQIQDTVYTPSGALFNGTVSITWTGSLSPTGNSPAPYNTSVKIYNGALSVLLVPSTTITPTAYYQAVYNSDDGLTSWTETWQIAPSVAPLTLSQIRVTNVSSTGSGGTGGTGTTGNVAIDQVTGLNTYLTSLNTSINTLTSIVNSLNTSVANVAASLANLTAQVNSLTSGVTFAVFTDNETPTGAMNGVNTAFTLANAPATAASLKLYRNGVLLANGVDYTLSSNAITFSNNAIPQSGDTLTAYYRLPGSGPASAFVDNETPQGTSDGNNLTFTLAQLPNPTASLKLFKNGILLQQNADYTLNGSTITFASQSVTPEPGDSLSAYYRTLTTNAQPEGISLNRDSTAPARPDR